MPSDKTGKILHDKSTLNKRLTPEENDTLQKWYEQQDRNEFEMLLSNKNLTGDIKIQNQIDAILTKIGIVADQIPRLTHENRLLRNKIGHLQRQLSKKQMERTR